VLAAAQQLLPDLIVLDMSLPGRSGMRILPEFQATLPSVGIVMLTTQIDPLYEEEALAIGADAFVAKGLPRLWIV
jgi:DNA-binding NarL/FixJ family response regulator